MKVKLSETYPGSYLSLMCGHNFKKDGKIIEVDEDVPEIKLQLEQGYLEVVEVNSEEKKEKIITDNVPKSKTVKEVATPGNKEKVKEALKKDGDTKDKPKPEEDFI